MFTIDLYTSYTALLTVFTTIQRIFAQKYISERLFMNISAKNIPKSKNSDAAHWLDHFQIRLSVGLNCFGISFTKIIRLDGQIQEHWTAADDISESGKVHREWKKSQTKIQLLFMVFTKSKTQVPTAKITLNIIFSHEINDIYQRCVRGKFYGM